MAPRTCPAAPQYLILLSPSSRRKQSLGRRLGHCAPTFLNKGRPSATATSSQGVVRKGSNCSTFGHELSAATRMRFVPGTAATRNGRIPGFVPLGRARRKRSETWQFGGFKADGTVWPCGNLLLCVATDVQLGRPVVLVQASAHAVQVHIHVAELQDGLVDFVRLVRCAIVPRKPHIKIVQQVWRKNIKGCQ